MKKKLTSTSPNLDWACARARWACRVERLQNFFYSARGNLPPLELDSDIEFIATLTVLISYLIHFAMDFSGGASSPTGTAGQLTEQQIMEQVSVLETLW